MILRLLADADLNELIVEGLVRKIPQIDFKKAKDVPLEGLPDPLVLEAAAHEERVLVSHDVTTMPKRL